ncbi:hypothetical protein K4K49_004010 [Colletotrichum sp. SAR 10_70]|nr:hypothetical protein K4K50_002899 [Colletotrichum sp. SAR 10_71]KAI8171729.1 hypothetical protein K4K49_004010 [Colletotrichum sp. SAR 10_70]
MSDETQEQPPPDAEVGWQELKTENGNKYRVKADDYDIADRDPDGDEPAAAGPPFKDVEVYWTVGSSGAPSQDVQNKTAITWYRLDKAPWYVYYKYRLTINTNDTYNYEFTDQSPDTYSLGVWQKSVTHTVDFDSSSPTIVKISGS